MKKLKDIILLAVCVFVIALIIFHGFRRPAERIQYHFETDTLYLRDTIRPVIPPPDTIYLVRVDTLFFTIQDTVSVPVFLPIERKEIKTSDFRAIIEGYKPNLVSMELYPETKIVTNTVTTKKNPRFGIGIQAGAGMIGNQFTPYIGIGIQYNIVSF